MPEAVLAVEGLRTHFFSRRGVAKAVDGVDLAIAPDETLAVVGESGCGKTMLALSILRLVPHPGRIVEGRVRFAGKDLLGLPEKALRTIRGNAISMIFQEPMTSLNPVFRIGDQIAETLRLHRGLGQEEALDAARALLVQVGIPEPGRRLKTFPHELSGGMRQRVMIAMALACDPKVLLADEPTTALDVTIQAEILDLMRELKTRRQAAVMLITHDLGIVAETSRKLVIMYAGRIVERGDVLSFFKNPLHPYAKLLLAAVPRIGRRAGELAAISGSVPDLLRLPEGCHFHPRCPSVFDRCRLERPPLYGVGGREVRCFLYDGGGHG